MNKLPKRYKPNEVEERLQQFWEEEGVYHFSSSDSRPGYAIDTPPPTVSGDLHLGHCYSYSQTDFMARFWRMNGFNVFYPMGWDDNGLPTERLVEKRLGIKPVQVGRERFIEAIVEVSREMEARYEHLWRRLSLSVDWRYAYTTISKEARKVSQFSFIDLYRKGLAYRASAPSIWCSTCGTAIAQAEVDDLERETNFITVAFKCHDGQTLPIATTRPELLPACVAIFVHPDDARHQHLVGKTASTPIFQREVPIMADPRVEPEKGTGIVMCCTFGDTTDVEWWHTYKLPLLAIVDRDGRLNELAGAYAGLSVQDAREKIIADLEQRGLLLNQVQTTQTVRVHERCDTPVEYIETKQWFVKLLDRKGEFLEAGRKIDWHPSHMQVRFEHWVQNLGWDWCVSRQRYYGVPFPVWYCAECGEIVVAEEVDLPVNPLSQQPSSNCPGCGGAEFAPETDVMDTWATSSASPLIAGKWLEEKELFAKVFPMSLRPHSHEIIRTWTFYTIVKSLYHLDKIPWSNVAISGHGLLAEGGKISKSRGGGPIDPIEMMEKYSADAVRYWAASMKLGRDSAVSEKQIAIGHRLVTKLWNVARFTLRFLQEYQPPATVPDLLPLDRWILSRLQNTIQRATDGFKEYDHVTARDEIESFFWTALADNYLEMVKTRLYELDHEEWRWQAAQYTLHHVLTTVIKMLAPIMPHITEEIFQLHFAQYETAPSIHLSRWPQVSPHLVNDSAETFGEVLVAIATEVRRFKSTAKLSMGTPLKRLQLSSPRPELLKDMRLSQLDIKSVTRAQDIHFSDTPTPQSSPLPGTTDLWLAIEE